MSSRPGWTSCWCFVFQHQLLIVYMLFLLCLLGSLLSLLLLLVLACLIFVPRPPPTRALWRPSVTLRSASCLVVLVVDDDESACDVAIESSLTKNCFQNDHSKVMAWTNDYYWAKKTDDAFLPQRSSFVIHPNLLSLCRHQKLLISPTTCIS